jgi:hypothetical protein
VKTVSNFLFDLARSITQGQPDPEDSVIDVAAGIVPSMELMAALDAPVVTSQTAPQNGSFHTSVFLTVNAASGALGSLQATLAKGLWRFDIQGSINSNYTNASLFAHDIQLRYPNGTIYLAGFNVGGAAAAPNSQTVSRSLTILIPVQSELWTEATNNAAGQNANSAWDILCTKLL